MDHLSNQYKKLIFSKYMPISFILILFMFIGLGGKLKAQNHLLLSEIVLQIAAAEFIEIYNPTNSTINLDNYFLADNQEYPYVPIGPSPVDPGDFIVQFPPGASINSNETVVVAINGSDFESYYGQKADFEIVSADAGTSDMIIIDQLSPGISNNGEGIALFYWNGSDNIVQDVDLMNAGIPNESSAIVDKTLIDGYLPDAHTMPVQDQTEPPGDGFSTKRILLEGENEIHSGGNGITGDDETSEDISVTWDDDYTSSTPGSTTLTVTSVKVIPGSKHTIICYPNPFSEFVTFIIPNNQNKITIELFDMQGRKVMTEEIGSDEKVNMEGLNQGVYFYNLNIDGEKINGKLIKQL